MSGNDNDLGWTILVKEDGVHIHFPSRNETINLGPKEAVFTAWADKMGEEDFGERPEPLGEPVRFVPIDERYSPTKNDS